MSVREEKMYSLANRIWYVVKLIDRKDIITLKEYLDYNVLDFVDFISEYKQVPSSKYKCLTLFMCMFYFTNEGYPYFIEINRDTQRTEYLLTKDVDNPFDMDEATTFQIDFRPKKVHRKLSFNHTGFFVEEYRPVEGVKTTIYDIDKIKDAVCTTYEVSEAKRIMNEEFETPSFCSNDNKILTILVKPVTDKYKGVCTGYEIEENYPDGKVVKTPKTGDSLYSVYYDYMIEKGYFFDSDEKRSGIRVKK